MPAITKDEAIKKLRDAMQKISTPAAPVVAASVEKMLDEHAQAVIAAHEHGESGGFYTDLLSARAAIAAQIGAPVVAEGLIEALLNIRDYRTDVDATIAARSMRFYAEQALAAHPVAPAVVAEGLAEARHQAVSALYFDDGSDFKIALWNIVKALAPEWMDELDSNPKAVFDKSRAALAAAHPVAGSPAEAFPTFGHPDDSAVDCFAVAMKSKMAAARAKGRGGWDNEVICPAERLQAMLRDHVGKGDPVDVGNFAMMLFNRGERTAAEPMPADTCAEMRALCSACGGTGDVTSIDGEWRGACDCAASKPMPPSEAHDILRDMLAIQEACGLHTDEYAPGSVIEYIKELEDDQRTAAPVPASEAASVPVAWGLLEIQDPELTNDAQLAAYWERKGRKVTALYAAPAPPTDAKAADLPENWKVREAVNRKRGAVTNMISDAAVGEIMNAMRDLMPSTRTATPVPASEAAKQADQAHVMPPFAAPASQHDANVAALRLVHELSRISMTLAADLIQRGPHTFGDTDYLDRDWVMRRIMDWRAEWDATSEARNELTARCRAEGGSTNDSNTNFAAPAAPTDAKPTVTNPHSDYLAAFWDAGFNGTEFDPTNRGHALAAFTDGMNAAQSVRDALEQAAKICERLPSTDEEGPDGQRRNFEPSRDDCVVAIRALIQSPQPGEAE